MPEAALDAVDVNGRRTAYRRAGDGPPLVLLHGAYEDGRFWAGQLDALSGEFTVIAPDVAGFGQSDDPLPTWTADDYADWLAGFIGALGLEKPAVLGLSFGSVLALATFRRHPRAIGRLVLASAYAGWAGSLSAEEVARRLAVASAELDQPAEEIIARWLPTLLTEGASADVRELVAELMRGFHPAGMRAALHGLGAVDLRDVLPRINVPTLLLYGDADLRSPVETVGRDLHAQISGSRLVVIPGAPHLANLEQPQAFNAAVREFLMQPVTHPNVQIIRELFAAYERGDDAGMRRLLAADVVYRLPGTSWMSGEHRGRDAVIDLWNRQKAVLGGRPYVARPYATAISNERVVLLAEVTASRGDTDGVFRLANMYRVANGQVAECVPHVFDLYAFDAFWSVDDPRAPAERWVRALCHHDLEAAAACFAEDYRDEAPLRPGEHVAGRAGVRANVTRLFEAIPDLRAEIVRAVADGDTVWMEWRMRGTRTDGSPFEFAGVNLFGVVAGEFVWGRIYSDFVAPRGGIDAQLARMTGQPDR